MGTEPLITYDDVAARLPAPRANLPQPLARPIAPFDNPPASMANEAHTEPLIKIAEVATRLGLKRRGVEGMIARKVIPVIRLSARCLRFRWSEVEGAVNRYRQKEIS